MTDQPKKPYDLDSTPPNLESHSVAEGTVPYIASPQLVPGLVGHAHEVEEEEEAAASEVPGGAAILQRLLVRGEQLAATLPAPPDALWEVGSEVHLYAEATPAESADELDWVGGTDAAWEPFEGGEVAPQKGLLPWWLRPLWGLGIVALVGMVWWRLPPEPNKQPPPSARIGLKTLPAAKRQVVPPVARPMHRQHKLFPAHRGTLRPKGLPLGRSAPGLAPTPIRRTKPAFLASGLHFSLFARRGKQTWQVPARPSSVPGPAPQAFQADDELRFGYKHSNPLPQPAYVTLVIVDAKGGISPIYPGPDGAPVLLRTSQEGKRRWLSDGAVLDDSPLAERAFVCITKRPLSLAFVKDSLRKLRPFGAGKLETLPSLSLGCLHQQSWWLPKVERGAASRPAPSAVQRNAARPPVPHPALRPSQAPKGR